MLEQNVTPYFSWTNLKIVYYKQSVSDDLVWIFGISGVSLDNHSLSVFRVLQPVNIDRLWTYDYMFVYISSWWQIFIYTKCILKGENAKYFQMLCMYANGYIYYTQNRYMNCKLC